MPGYIPQTNRTILFEEFSEFLDTDSPRMDVLLEKDLNETHDLVKKQLTVKSFSHFMETFKPKYYEYIATDEQGNFVIKYDIKKPSGNPHYIEHDLINQPFYDTIMKIYDDKKNSGQTNYEFAYSTLTEIMFSPQKAMEKAQHIGKELVFNYNKFCECEERKSSPDKKAEYFSKIQRLERQICDEYLSQSPLNFLPLAIAQIKNHLGQETTIDSDDKPKEKSLQPATLLFTKKGFTALPVVDKEIDSPKLPSDKKIPLLSDIVEHTIEWAEQAGKNQLTLCSDSDNDKTEKAMITMHNKIMKELIISVFVPTYKFGQTVKFSDKDLKKMLCTCEQMYKISQENFCRHVVGLLEKVLNVRAFFDNAGKNAELVVSNCSLRKLMETDGFEEFIISQGTRTNEDKIWFAIIPGIYDEKFNENNIEEQKNDFDFYNHDSYNEKKSNSSKYFSMMTLSELKTAMNLMGKAKIITFFNFKGDSKTSFRALDVDRMKDYKEALKTVPSPEYAVFCYPNFEILPPSRSSVLIGTDQFGENEYIKLPSVYIDSSYIAAALYVKSQNLDILKQSGFKVDTSLGQPVRFNFESDFKVNNEIIELSQVFPTMFSGELNLSWDKDLISEIRKDGGFGFCFCGDSKIYTKNNLQIQQKKIYILCARTLNMEKPKTDNNDSIIRFRPIFKTMVQTYIEILWNLTRNENAMKQIFSDEYMRDGSKECINNIVYSKESGSIKTDESIVLKNNEGRIEISIVYDRDRDDFDVSISEKSN